MLLRRIEVDVNHPFADEDWMGPFRATEFYPDSLVDCLMTIANNIPVPHQVTKWNQAMKFFFTPDGWRYAGKEMAEALHSYRKNYRIIEVEVSSVAELRNVIYTDVYQVALGPGSAHFNASVKKE